MVIQHNIAAQNSNRMQKIVSGKLTGTSEKLSSGYRINRGADDAAGLSISEKLRFQIRGLNRGSVNIEEGVGYCQVADGALHEMHDMLHRTNELCIQAANGTLSETDRKYIDNEVQNLKAEINRICRTTKFNEEYIFRCDDVIPNLQHEVYNLTFSGRPKDLFIYTDGLAPDSYAGVAFRGRRYTWDEISPDMYDPNTKEFRKGRYSIIADDDTVLTLVCDEDGALPKVSRRFLTTADGLGVYINSDLVKWDDMHQAGNTYTFDYHGMTVSFTKGEDDNYEDLLTKISGTVWESEYDVWVDGLSLDAKFSTSTYYFRTAGEANTRIEKHVTNGSSTKYRIHAVDGNKGGTIPVYDTNGNFLRNDPFDGVWIEGTNKDWSFNNKPLFAMTWKQFGFDCNDYTYVDPNNTNNHPPYCDWGNNSTDIWVGTNPSKAPTKDPENYPPDALDPNTAYDYSTVKYDDSKKPYSCDYYSGYDPYAPFHFVNGADQNEVVRFIFSVINETSKDQAVATLNNIDISYPKITPSDKAEFANSPNGGKISSAGVSLHSYDTGEKGYYADRLSLADEYYLGRDYENGQREVLLKNNGGANENWGQLTYNNGFSISYGYDSARTTGSMTLNQNGSILINGFPSSIVISNLNNSIISNGIINLPVGNTITAVPANVSSSPSIRVNLSGGRSCDGVTSGMTLDYRYNISDFFAGGGATITHTADPNGNYIIDNNNRYQEYNRYNYEPYIPGVPQPQRYSISMTSANGQTLEQYFESTVYPDIANATKVQLKTTEFPRGQLAGSEHPHHVNVTRYKTPYQLEQGPPEKPPEEEPEFLPIQCSSNVIDNIYIQKQKLSVYRLGLLNVGTLSEVQATGCIDIVGEAITKVSLIRSRFGASQNRLEHAYNINRNTHENTQHGETMIRDADMAAIMVEQSNNSVLQQSANAMLAQANQANQGVLTLLQ